MGGGGGAGRYEPCIKRQFFLDHLQNEVISIKILASARYQAQETVQDGVLS